MKSVCHIRFVVSLLVGEAVRKSTFDTGPPRPVFLDSVLCGGFEDSLLNCSSGGLRNHDCNSFEHAGVRCSDGRSSLHTLIIPQ